jgi:hypothetical protein
MTLAERCQQMVVDLEWSMKDIDGNGPRCPRCGVLSNCGVGPHAGHCSLGKLCDDIRLVQKADELRRGE